MKNERVDEELLEQISGLHSVPQGAYNIRKNGKSISRQSTANIEVLPEKNGNGLEIRIKANTKNESVHMPVILTQSGLNEVVYNDFYVGENAEVQIVAGCGIHNAGKDESKHDGIHRFFLEKNAKVKYIEKHIAIGTAGEKTMNPQTEIYLKAGSEFEMDTFQMEGVSRSVRKTSVVLEGDSKFTCMEKIVTKDNETASTNFVATMKGKGSSCHIVSRAVARGESVQEFRSKVIGDAECFGHTECDCIVMDKARVTALPEVEALNSDANLVHEAAIGKIAGEQITKLMTMGLDEKQAEEQIIKGFLR